MKVFMDLTECLSSKDQLHPFAPVSKIARTEHDLEVYLLRGTEALWIEFLRVRVISRIAMNVVGGKEYINSGRYADAFVLVILYSFSTKNSVDFSEGYR